MDKIKQGNSFIVQYSINQIVDGVETPINISEFNDLSVSIKPVLHELELFPKYEYSENVISISILPKHQPYLGQYRVIFKSKLNTNVVFRNPIAYQIVQNVEDESNGSNGDINIQRIQIVDTIGLSVSGSFDVSKMWDALADEGSEQIHASHILEATGNFITLDDIPSIPSKTSELTNDSNFITSDDIPAIPTKTSELTNDSEFTTSSDLVEAKKLLFIDLWLNSVGTHGKYDSQTKKFSLNGITDITYDEAVAIYEARTICRGLSDKLFFIDRNPTIRTNIPYEFNASVDYMYFQVNYQQTLTTLSVRRFGTYGSVNFMWKNMVFRPFYGCTALKTVLGVINISAITTASGSFEDVPVLESIQLFGLKNSMGFFKGCPNINAASLSYLVTNAANTTSVTVLVSAATYAKLIDTSNTTWNSILTAASDKNIQFAS